MNFLNYHYLRYFRLVARGGSIARARKDLHREHPTIGAQFHRLEEIRIRKLFERQARRLALARFGRLALHYADEIFPIGRAKAVRQRFYAISAERKIGHPAVIAVIDTARKDLFA